MAGSLFHNVTVLGNNEKACWSMLDIILKLSAKDTAEYTAIKINLVKPYNIQKNSILKCNIRQVNILYYVTI